MEEQQIKEEVLNALTRLGKGTAEDVVKCIEDTNPGLPNKELIGGAQNLG